jgi:RNA polymerase-binding transcription factor DksA
MNDYTEFKEMLLEEKESLEKELAGHGRIIDPETGDWAAQIEEQDKSEEDETIEGDRMAEFHIDVALVTVLEQKYDKVRKALASIEKGTYGICEVTGNPIPLERLKADPTATTVVEEANSH